MQNHPTLWFCSFTFKIRACIPLLFNLFSLVFQHVMVLADCLLMKWMEVKGVLIAVGDDSVYDRRILPRSHRTWLLRPALFRPAPPIPISHIDASARRSGQSTPPNDTAEGHGRLMEPWYILLSRFASTIFNIIPYPGSTVHLPHLGWRAYCNLKVFDTFSCASSWDWIPLLKIPKFQWNFCSQHG